MRENPIPIVTFDFDETLSRPDVQEYAKELLDLGYDVWVITSRYDNLHIHLYNFTADNNDLWEVVDRLGISRWKVRFTNMEPKTYYLNETGVIWHLDDDRIELDFINRESKTVGVQVKSPSYKNKCQRLLNLPFDENDLEL